MRRDVWYESIDPYYSDEIQTFIGSSCEELDNLEYEHDKWLGREHPAGIRFIFDKHIIYESDCEEWEKEMNENNYRRYIAKKKKERNNEKTNTR